MDDKQDAQSPQGVEEQDQQEVITEPTTTIVNCGNCAATFEFPTGGIASFGFDCTNCGAHNHIELGDG